MTSATAPGIVADSSADALKTQLSQVWDSLAGLGEDVGDDGWRQPTPCPGWDVAAQYAHVIGTESMLLGRPAPEVDPGTQVHVRNDIGGFNERWVAALAPSPRAEVLQRFAEVTAARREALAAMDEEAFSAPSWTPVGQADYRRFMQIRVFDCWVHEQDVRDAVGREGHESGPVADQSLDEIVRALGYIVGKKAAAPDGSSVAFALKGAAARRDVYVAVDGRARVVEALDAPPTTTIEIPFRAFMRLACGRVDPTAVLGDARLSGDQALGRRVLDNLAFTI